MFALAVIERELRVRTRRSATSWVRVLVGVVASVSAIATLNWQSRFSGGSAAGLQMFSNLAWMTFAFCVVEGARTASDAVSRERREGTLGLLLLTELSGFEVVLGKFAAASLTSFYVLLAVFPAMAIALATGGVTAGEFWRTEAALVDTLFLAVAAAIWVSARSQDDLRALLGTLGVLTLLIIAPALLGLHVWLLGYPNCSPGVVLSLAGAQSYSTNPGQFWSSLLAVNALSWILMLTAGHTIARAWRSESKPATPVTAAQKIEDQEAHYSIPPSLHARPKTTGRQLLETDPVLWLESRQADLRSLVWLALLLEPCLEMGVQFAFSFFSSSQRLGGILTGSYLAARLAAQLMLAFVACRRFAQERAAGTLESLLGTPISPRHIALAHWRALWRVLRLPLAVSVLIPIVIPLAVGMTQPRWRGGGVPFLMLVFQVLRVLTNVINAFAVCWLGMWLGVRASSPTRAVGLTLLWTLVIPYAFQSLLSMLASFFLQPTANAGIAVGYYLFWIITVLGGTGYLLAVLFWARKQLLNNLRQGVSGTGNVPLVR